LKPKKKVRKATAGPALKQAIQKVIAGTSETKYVMGQIRATDFVVTAPTLDLPTGFTSAITSTRELYALIPQISEGAGVHQRVGDTIQPTSLTINLRFAFPFNDSQQSGDVTAHMFVLSAKSVKSLNNLSAVPITLLLDNGQGSAASFDGTNQHAMWKVNTNAFTVHKYKRIRFQKTEGLVNGGTLGNGQTCMNPSQHHVVRFRVPLPKKLKYLLNSETYPTNSAPFLCIGYTQNDTSNSAGLLAVYAQGNCMLHFKDS
jgi:hypothetical protein